MDFSGESTEDKLDNDFRRILCIIKQYIQYINSNHQLSLYRSWLEKLSTAHEEKMERNMYLFELARQIKSNKLLPPFNRHPPTGALRTLPKINFFRPTDVENIIHDTAQPNSVHFNLEPTYNEFTEDDFDYPQQQIPPNQNQRNNKPHCPNKFGLQDDGTHTLFVQPCYCNADGYADEGSDTPMEMAQTPLKIKKRKSKTARSFQKLPVAESISRVQQEKHDALDDESTIKDDSSWCDLTDTSQTSVNNMASGDNQKSPTKVQEKVKQFGGKLKVLEQLEADKSNKTSNNKNSYDSNKLNFSDEVENISLKIQDLNQAKLSLKDTNFISLDWKKTIEGLQLRLTETLNQNNELKSIVNALQQKLKEESSKNKEQNDDCKQKKCEMRRREIEALKQIQVDNIKKLEKSFQIKLEEAERNYHKKIEKLKNNYETKIGEMHLKHDHAKRDKDQEMCRLSEIIQQQCIRMSNEIAALRNQIEHAFSNQNGDDKIVVLQKCVSKMDRLFQKSEKEYQKQIDKLRQELDLKDKVMQIQLKTQRAELIARTSVEKQKQFDEVINNLEMKYIKMLEYHENQVMAIKGRDEEKIEHLKQLLDENNIVYDNVFR